MTEPAELIQRHGMWPRALIRLDLHDGLTLEQASRELAAVARRLRVGAVADFSHRPLVAYPNETVDEIANRWIREKRASDRERIGELPRSADVRWTPLRKQAVLDSVICELVTRDEAMARYNLSPSELADWERRYREGGVAALAVRP